MRRRVAAVLAAVFAGQACDECGEPEDPPLVCAACDPIALLLAESDRLKNGELAPLDPDLVSRCAAHEVDIRVETSWLDDECWDLAAHYTARSLDWADADVEETYAELVSGTFACRSSGEAAGGCAQGSLDVEMSFVGPPELSLEQHSPVAMLVSAPQLEEIRSTALEQDLPRTIDAILAGEDCRGVTWVAGISCTAFLVGPRHVLTARHCVDEDLPAKCGGQASDRLHNERLVFDYHEHPQEGSTLVGGLTVVACGTKDGQPTVDPQHDWALLELDEPPPGNRSPLALPPPGDRPSSCEQVYVVGHPLGHPQTRSGTTEPSEPAAWIRPIETPSVFYTTIDVISGFSGAPVLAVNGDRLVGLLVSGTFEGMPDAYGCHWIYECGPAGCDSELDHGRAVDLSVIAAELAPHLAE